MPKLQIARRVGPHQHGELPARFALPERPNSVHRIGGPGALELDPLEGEARLPGDRQAHHAGTRLRRGRVATNLERLLAGGDEAKFLEPERLDDGLGDEQMAVVDGVEGPAEETDRHGGQDTGLGLYRVPVAGAAVVSRGVGQEESSPGVVGWNRQM